MVDRGAVGCGMVGCGMVGRGMVGQLARGGGMWAGGSVAVRSGAVGWVGERAAQRAPRPRFSGSLIEGAFVVVSPPR